MFGRLTFLLFKQKDPIGHPGQQGLRLGAHYKLTFKAVQKLPCSGAGIHTTHIVLMKQMTFVYHFRAILCFARSELYNSDIGWEAQTMKKAVLVFLGWFISLSAAAEEFQMVPLGNKQAVAQSCAKAAYLTVTIGRSNQLGWTHYSREEWSQYADKAEPYVISLINAGYFVITDVMQEVIDSGEEFGFEVVPLESGDDVLIRENALALDRLLMRFNWCTANFLRAI
jgi:hypothetical protein